MAEKQNQPQTESHLRSVMKAFTWRIVATTTTTTIAYFITGTVEAALTIGGIEFVVNEVLCLQQTDKILDSGAEVATD